MDAERSLFETLTRGSFLSENAEAFGLVSDAHPVTTPTLMIAGSGHAADDGMHPPTFAVSGKGVDGLYDGLYSGLLHRSDANERILRMTFGESEGRQNHPIARYCAALTTALTHQLLSEAAEATPEECVRLLSQGLPDGIDALRDVMRAAVGPRPGSEHFFSVSFCACRVTPAEQGGRYALDVFHAGDFGLYVLDGQGLAPLLICDSDVLEPLDTSEVTLSRITLDHPEPFALLLLSKSIFDLSAKDFRAMQDRAGLLWRYRMRLEDYFVRLVTSAVREDELPELAERFFTGRAAGRDSATGAWMILGGNFDAFRGVCLSRLRELEQLISLLPKGYDPAQNAMQIPLEQVERAFVLSAFRTRPGLVERTMDAVSRCVSQRLNHPSEAGEQDGDGLTPEVVACVFESFDCANRADRMQIQKNCQVIHELLGEHWTTLRPVFCRYPMMDEVPQGVKDKSDAAATTCLALKKRIAYLVGKRRRALEDIREQMQNGLEVLSLHGNDWISGVGGDGSAYQWFDEVGKRLSARVEMVRDDYEKTTDRLRGLQAAYTQERALSFALDIAEDGIWHTCYLRIMDGELPADIWRVYANGIEEQASGYADFLQVIRTISERNLALREKIEGRGAERRTVMTLSGDEDWQIACMLGALREDASWGEHVSGLADNGFRNEYKALLRRWMEEKELLTRQKDAFEAYRDMYERYTGEG